MSHVEHQSLCITSWDKDVITDCRERIQSIGLKVSEIIKSDVNGYCTFFVPPSGSKAGWDEAKAHLSLIGHAEKIIKDFECEDGSNCIDYIKTVYGDHEG